MKNGLFLVGLLCFATLTGCNSNATLRNAQEAYRRGDMPAAQVQINSFVTKEGKGVDRIIAYLEKGSIERELGQALESNESFAIADAEADLYDEKPDVSLSKEGIATITNLNALPYRGYNYDRIMLSTYRAINHLELGNIDAARVDLRKAYQRQTDAVDLNAKRIEKAQEAAKQANESQARKGKKGYDVNRAKKNTKFQDSLAAQYSDLDQYTAYRDYVNPFTEWLQGIYYLTAGVDGSDYETGRKSIERVKAMIANNTYLADDYQMAENVAAGKKIEPITYVIFATGTAPKRGQIRIDIPLFLVTRSVDYVGANFPRLIKNNDYLAKLSFQADGQEYTTQVLANMDAVVSREFKNELPIVITKTLISAGTKAAIAYGLKQVTKNQGWVGLATNIATTVYQVANNQADLRTWASLPKQFQYARFATPKNRIVQIRGPHQSSNQVELIGGTVNFVFVRSVNAASELRISQFSLGKGAEKWIPKNEQLSTQP